MSHLVAGQIAPDFSLKNQDGETITLSSLLGDKTLVLYFYPRASTPGCTVQACALRDSQADLSKHHAIAVGISPDSVKKIKNFADKQALNFCLLADSEHQVAQRYGVWQLKKFMGRESMGVVRTSFIIDKTGKILHVLNKVNTKTHHQDVLALLSSL